MSPNNFGWSVLLCFVHHLTFVNPLTPELNPAEQRSLPRFFTGDFKFYCLLLEKKSISHRLLPSNLMNKIFHSAYELVNLGINVHLFM